MIFGLASMLNHYRNCEVDCYFGEETVVLEQKQLKEKTIGITEDSF